MGAIIAEAADRLEGDWVLVGGGAAALWFDAARMTEDVDLVPVSPDPAARYQLLDLADALGVPVEALNSAADFFLRRLDGWQDDLVLVSEGRRGRVFRPGPALFLRLKLRRLSALDLADCEGLLDHLAREGTGFDARPVLAELDALASTADAELDARRARLRERLVRAGCG